jgi:hypothetical protein
MTQLYVPIKRLGHPMASLLMVLLWYGKGVVPFIVKVGAGLRPEARSRSQRLKIDFPEGTTMRISHEANYQALYIQGRGALKRDLSACLRSGRAVR